MEKSQGYKNYFKGYMKKYENTDKRKQWRKNYKKMKSNQIKCQELARVIKIPKGKLCVICNIRLANIKHHEDYSKPYEVIFCCKSCHYELDLQRRANNLNKNKKGEQN